MCNDKSSISLKELQNKPKVIECSHCGFEYEVKSDNGIKLSPKENSSEEIIDAF